MFSNAHEINLIRTPLPSVLIDAFVLKLQPLKSDVMRARGNFSRRTHVARHWLLAFKIVHVPDFFCRKIAQASSEDHSKS